MRSFRRELASLAGLFLFGAAIALAGHYGPTMIQQYGRDIDNPSAFWTNIGGGDAGKLAIGDGLTNVGGRLTVIGGDSSAPSVGSNLTAAGTNQATATPVTAQISIFSTVTSGTGALLTNTNGTGQQIYDRGTTPMLIYPPSGTQIETFGVNAPIMIVPCGFATFSCVSAIQYYVSL